LGLLSVVIDRRLGIASLETEDEVNSGPGFPTQNDETFMPRPRGTRATREEKCGPRLALLSPTPHCPSSPSLSFQLRPALSATWKVPGKVSSKLYCIVNKGVVREIVEEC
jgi:hypothetical protein